MTRICQSCFDPECNHIQCYLETPEPTDEEGDTGITFADLLRLHGSQLTDLEPKKRDDGRWQVADRGALRGNGRLLLRSRRRSLGREPRRASIRRPLSGRRSPPLRTVGGDGSCQLRTLGRRAQPAWERRRLLLCGVECRSHMGRRSRAPGEEHGIRSSRHR
jgi:hypothetical protein